MPYIYSREEVEENTQIKPKQLLPTKQPSLLIKEAKDSHRAAGQHHFLVANMFGPIDWAIEIPSETAAKPKQQESHWIVDANMFGPMDWAAELEKSEEDVVALKPAA